MATHIKLSDLEDALEWSSVDGFDNEAFVDRQTGAIHWRGEGAEGELPDDLDDDARYAVVPTKRDLDLGQQLVFEFVAESLPKQYDEVRAIFRQRGAWRTYKDFLHHAGQLDAWHAYAEKAQTDALREWAIQNGFEPA